MRNTRRDLIAHVGGKPTITQSMIIDRIVNLTLRIATMDRKFAESGRMTEHDTATYLAWSASLSRLVRDLGLKAAPEKPRTLAELRAKAAA